jgi:hypothetical protein
MRKLFVPFVLLLAFLGVAVSPVRADEPEADPKKLEEQMEKLLKAYNEDDVKKFFADWASQAESLANQQVYDALYKNGSKQAVGDYKPKTIKFRKEGSVLKGEILVVYFDAEFTKEKAGQVAVNYAYEKGAYKFIQVQIAKKQ